MDLKRNVCLWKILHRMGNWYNNNTLNFELNAENVSMLTIMYYL